VAHCPRWSADGKSLFFAIDNQLSVVDVTESAGSIQFSPASRPDARSSSAAGFPTTSAKGRPHSGAR
jgi:hypothetical protein